MPARPAILVVEDDTTARGMFRIALKQIIGDYPLYMCKGGIEALAYLQENPACCVITDYTMPVMDGLLLSKIISHQWPTLPVIIITGQKKTTLQILAQDQGIEGVTVLEKPVDMHRLRTLILPWLAE